MNTLPTLRSTPLAIEVGSDVSRKIMAWSQGVALFDVREYGVSIDGIPVTMCGRELTGRLVSTVLSGWFDSVGDALDTYAACATELPLEEGEFGPRIWEFDTDCGPVWFEETADGLSAFYRSER